MAKIAFLGLGSMGAPMAGRLVDAGHDVTVWNRSSERAEPLKRRGASVASVPREAGTGAEVALTMLRDAPALREVLFGESGLTEGLAAGSVLVEMSTVGPAAVREVRGRLDPAVAMLDAPVVGSTPRAEAGELAVLVGGDREAFDRCRQILETLGTPRWIGPLGAGAAMKLVANSTTGGAMIAIGEALALGRALDLDRGAVLEALSASYVGPLVQAKRAMLERREYPSQFRLELAEKDFGLIEEAAAEAGIALEGAALARRLFRQAMEAGFGGHDYAALAEYLESRAVS